MHLLQNGVWIAIVAHGSIGISLLFDKILLQRPEMRSLPYYVFWLGAMSIFGVVLAVLGFHMPRAGIAALAFGAGAIDLAAVWFYYRALKSGEASQTLAVMGGFSPLATALIAVPLLEKPLGDAGLIAFGLLVAGGFLMFATEKLNWRRILPSVLLASGLFGLANVLQKVVFDSAGFVSGYIFFTLGTFTGAMALLLRPAWRRQIFEQGEHAPPRSKTLYFANRVLAGGGSFLVFLAISRSTPAIVDAISGVRYVLVFLGAYLIGRLRPKWLHEDFGRRALIGKLAATGLIVAGLILVGAGVRQ